MCPLSICVIILTNFIIRYALELKQRKKMKMKNIILGTAMIAGLFSTSVQATDIKTTSPKGHELIKASVVNAEPANYTINVRSLSNLGADEDAPTFAVYISGSKPDTCGDFSETPLTYKKPEKYLRQFDLSQNPDIVTAINEYKCVIVPNKPM